MMSGSGSKVGPIGDDLIHQRAQRGLVSWLAIVAMALIAVAPSVSRLRQAWSLDAVMAMMAGNCSEHASHERHPDMPGHPGMPMEGDACGYCTMMCHSPALTSGIAFIVHPLPRASFSVVPGGALAPALALLEHRSRGPPPV